MIFASKNETVCCEVQTHFGSSPLASFPKCYGQMFMMLNKCDDCFFVVYHKMFRVYVLKK